MAMRSFPPPSALSASERSERAQPCVARIVEARDGAVSVEVEGVAEPVRARVASTLTAMQLADACAAGHSAVVVFERGDATLPIVVGLLAPAPTEEVQPQSVEVETRAASCSRTWTGSA